jgi:polyribonucleotide nucleotidyltransferase
LAKKSIQILIPLLIGLQQQGPISPEESITSLKNQGFEELDLINYLTMLTELKKKNLQALLSFLEKQNTPAKKDNVKRKSTKKIEEEHILLTEEEIFEIFKSDDTQLSRQFTVKDLKIMYRSIYNEDPRSNMKKSDLLNAIKNRIRIVSRGNSF